MKKKIRSWFKNYKNIDDSKSVKEDESVKKYDNIDLNLLLAEEFGMEIDCHGSSSVIIKGQGRILDIYENCICYYADNNHHTNNIPITNDIFILADIVREKYGMKSRFNIFTDAKIDGGV